MLPHNYVLKLFYCCYRSCFGLQPPSPLSTAWTALPTRPHNTPSPSTTTRRSWCISSPPQLCHHLWWQSILILSKWLSQQKASWGHNWRGLERTRLQSSPVCHLPTLRAEETGIPWNTLARAWEYLQTTYYASPVWSCSPCTTQQRRLRDSTEESLQSNLGSSCNTWKEALVSLNLTALSTRCLKDLEKFRSSLLHHSRLRHLLPPDVQRPERTTRHLRQSPTYMSRDIYKSPIPALISDLNNLWNMQILTVIHSQYSLVSELLSHSSFIIITCLYITSNNNTLIMRTTRNRFILPFLLCV